MHRVPSEAVHRAPAASSSRSLHKPAARRAPVENRANLAARRRAAARNVVRLPDDVVGAVLAYMTRPAWLASAEAVRLWRHEVQEAGLWAQMCRSVSGQPGDKAQLRRAVTKERGAKGKAFVKHCVKQRHAVLRQKQPHALLHRSRHIVVAMELEWRAVRVSVPRQENAKA